MKPRAALPILALTATLGVSGCTTVEYVPVSLHCTPPPEPALPAISRGELWDKVGDEHYRRIESYITQLWAYADEQAAMLDALCETQ